MKNVAVAITCLNSALTLPETMESLVHDDSLDGATIILLDGGSTDFSRHVANFFLEKTKKKEIIFRSLPDVHPAERINILIEERGYEYIYLCHSDDVYIPSAMREMLLHMQAGSMWALGSQCGFFQHPVDAATKRVIPYTGAHSTHPRGSNHIYCEMPFWWCISWNTVVIRAEQVADSGIRLNPEMYPFCNDYGFNWELAKLGRIDNVDFSSVLTRHRNSGDGPTNIDSLALEASAIRRRIQKEIGLEDFLGKHLTSVLQTVSYAYGNWDVSSLSYPKSHYRSLAEKMEAFSLDSDRLFHMSSIGKSLLNAL